MLHWFPTPLRAPDEYRLRQLAMLQVAGPVAGHPEPVSRRNGLTPVRLVLPAKGRADLVMPLAEDADGGEPRDEVLPTERNLFCAIHLQAEHMLRCLTAMSTPFAGLEARGAGSIAERVALKAATERGAQSGSHPPADLEAQSTCAWTLWTPSAAAAQMQSLPSRERTAAGPGTRTLHVTGQ